MMDGEKLDLIVREIQSMKTEMKDIREGAREIKRNIAKIELHLENVTDMGIRTIAEGHLDLSRKLDEVLQVSSEKELLVLRVRILEEELQKVKEGLVQTA